MKDSIRAIELPLIVKCFALILAFLSTSALTFGFPLPASATDWETFSPPTMEYTISLPVGISRIAKEDGMDAVIYSSADGDINFLIDDGSELDQFDFGQLDKFNREVTDGMMEKLRSEGVQNASLHAEETRGKGWHGKKTTVTIDGTTAMTLVVAITENYDVGYTLMATAGDDNPIVANFFKSLTVDPETATKSHFKKSYAYKTGMSVGNIVVGLIVIGFFVGAPGVVWLLITLGKRKKRKQN